MTGWICSVEEFKVLTKHVPVELEGGVLRTSF